MLIINMKRRSSRYIVGTIYFTSKSKNIEIDAHFFADALASDLGSDFVFEGIVWLRAVREARIEGCKLRFGLYHSVRIHFFDNRGFRIVASDYGKAAGNHIGIDNAVVVKHSYGMFGVEAIAVDADIANGTIVKIDSDANRVGHGAET